MDEFLSNIKLVTVGQSVWRDYETGGTRGTRLETVIAGDKHAYNTSNGEVVNNMYEKLVVKIPKQEIQVPMNVEVRLKGAEGRVYGDYRNQLSVVAEDIEVIGK